MTQPITSSATPGCAENRGAVAIISSAGGIPALFELLPALPRAFPLPILIAQHLSARAPSVLPNLLASRTALRSKWAEHGEIPREGIIYVTPPGHQITVRRRKIAITPLAPHSGSWLAFPDVLLKSFAECYGTGSVGVILSGMLPVGLSGLRAIHRAGGITMAQSVSSAASSKMPIGAIDLGKAEIVSSPAGLGLALAVIGTTESGARGESFISPPHMLTPATRGAFRTGHMH